MLHVLFNLQKDTSSPFNTIEDSGINVKFVNIVYDALLNTVSRRIHVLKHCNNYFSQEAIYTKSFSQIGMISEESLKTYLKWSHEICHRVMKTALVKGKEIFATSTVYAVANLKDRLQDTT